MEWEGRKIKIYTDGYLVVQVLQVSFSNACLWVAKEGWKHQEATCNNENNREEKILMKKRHQNKTSPKMEKKLTLMDVLEILPQNKVPWWRMGECVSSVTGEKMELQNEGSQILKSKYKAQIPWGKRKDNNSFI